MARRAGPGVTEQLKELRKRSGLSMRALADLLGYRGGSSYQRYEDPTLYKDSYLPLKLVRSLAEIFEGKGRPPISADEVYALAGLPAARGKGVEEKKARYQPALTPPPGPLAKDLPIRGLTERPNGQLHFEEDPIDWTYRSADLGGVQNAFGLYVRDDSMEDVLLAGQLLLIHPRQPARPNDLVVVERKDGTVLVKRLVRRGPSTIRLKQYNPAREFDVSLDQIRSIYRVIGISLP